MSKRNIITGVIVALLLMSCCGGLCIMFIAHRDFETQSAGSHTQSSGLHQCNCYEFPMTDAADIAVASRTTGRPQLPDSIVSAQGHFAVHYTTEGENAVAAVDSNNNLIPDRIDKIAEAFERSYAVEIEQLEYPLPPSFKNGTVSYDIYVLDLNNSFGITVTEDVDSTAWEQTNVSSYILFDNDFLGQNFHIHGDGAIKSTAAHEFFHAIQLGYVFRKMDSFFFELTAVWMEDQVFDELDNYLYYMDYFFDNPDIPLNGVSFTVPKIFKHIYGSCIFGFYIEDRFGADAIHQIWELMPNYSALTAANEIFQAAGSNFENEFTKFSIWNYFTGHRARPAFYSQGENYPEIALENETSIDYFSEQQGQGYHLTAGYYLFHPRAEGEFTARMLTDSTHHWKLAGAVYDSSHLRTFSMSPGQTYDLGRIERDQKILLIPCNIDRFTQPIHVYFKDNPELYTVYLYREAAPPANQPSFNIEKIYPNPFSAEVVFVIKKRHDSPVTIQIYNSLGQRIYRTTVNLTQEVNRISWSAVTGSHRAPAGVYFVKFNSANHQQVEKLILCR
ncbi:MAG: T9SS type A sorting domain-containing protein [Candidatus Zhuqueibacterota bacterium]